MRAIFYSNKGPVRNHNEDALFVAGNIITGCSMSLPAEVEIESSEGCFVVIDGMGGYEGGEKAARIVATSFMCKSEDWNISSSDANDKITSVLNEAVKRIAVIVQEKPELSAMGAVIAGVVFSADKMFIFNCGDCRVYRQQGQYLEKLSHDHSVVQELFDMGEIEEDEMRTHAKKNAVTACVSAKAADLDIYIREILHKGNERFLVCSDGVWEAMSIDEIEECLCENALETANNLAEKLFAMQEQCNDNVSFIIIES